MSNRARIISPAFLEFVLSMIAITLFTGVQGVFASSSTTNQQPSWEKPRLITDFQSLLTHSPFSLPTVEESSPLAERYALTGIVTINGDEEIFVFDRTDQSREMLTHTPNTKNMSLVTLVREGTALPQKATIRVGADTGTIGYLEAAPQQQVQPAGAPNGQNPAIPRPPPLPQLPGNPNVPGAFTGPRPNVITPQMRRIIRRPMVNPPQSPIQ